MSRDIKGTSLRELNDGLEKAVARCKRQVLAEIGQAEKRAVDQAVTISSELNRQLRRETKQKIDETRRQMEHRIEEAQRKLGARIDAQAKETARKINDMDRRHTQALNELADAVGDAIDETNRRITQEVNRLDRNIGVLADGLRTMDRNMQELSESVDQRFRNQQASINSIRQDVQSIFDKQEADENAKLLAAGAALALLEAVRERTDVERYAPKSMLDKVALLEARLRGLEHNPDSCTITDANNLLDETIVMEREAKRVEAEWLPLYESTLTAAKAVLKMIEANNVVKIPSVYNGADVDLQADYWTHGAYGNLLKEIQSLNATLETIPVDKDRLKEINNKIEELRIQADRLIVEAAELGSLSEQRIIISNNVLNAMINQGWELKEDPDYMGGETECDSREGTFAVLRKNMTGEELSILVLPEEKDGKRGSQIIFHRNDDLPESAGAFMTRMEEIKREIEKSGYKLGDLREPGSGDGKIDLLRTGKDMRKKGASKDLKTKLQARSK